MLDNWMAKQGWLRALQSCAASMLARGAIRADTVTAAAALAGGLAGIAFAAGLNAAGLAALWLSAACDALDGAIARRHQGATLWGGVLDLVSDRWVEAAALLGIVWRHPMLEFAAAVVLASWYVNIAVFLAVGSALGGGDKLIRYPPGLVERSEAFLFFTALVFAGRWGVHLCYAYAAAEAFTALQRLLFARRHLR